MTSLGLNIPSECRVELLVRLECVDPSPWRLLRIPTNITLFKLHEVLQLAMGWECYHPFRYQIGDDLYGRSDLDVGVKDVSNMTLFEILSTRSGEFAYIYDLLAHWRHTIFVREICDVGSSVRCELVAAEHGCPADDGRGPSEWKKGDLRILKLDDEDLASLQARVGAVRLPKDE